MGVVINGQRFELRHEVNAVLVPELARRLTHQVAKQSSPAGDRSSEAIDSALFTVAVRLSA